MKYVEDIQVDDKVYDGALVSHKEVCEAANAIVELSEQDYDLRADRDFEASQEAEQAHQGLWSAAGLWAGITGLAALGADPAVVRANFDNMIQIAQSVGVFDMED